MTTIDAKITESIKGMHLKLKKANPAGADEAGKFRMVTSGPPAVASL